MTEQKTLDPQQMEGSERAAEEAETTGTNVSGTNAIGRPAENESAPPSPDTSTLEGAVAYEEGIAREAEAIRAEANGTLSADLFLELWPLLRRPIPEAFIQTVPAVTGKPYESTGIKSVQVQIDRMDNVLTPLWWDYEDDYSEDGKVATVEVRVWGGGEPLVRRRSSGGVDRGSTQGNIRKGAFTNAAKLAFARLGVGHEVYIGTSDLDPDVDADIAAQTDGKSEPPTIGKEVAKKMVDWAWEIPKAKAQLQLAASHVAKKDVGDCSTKAKATTALSKLTFSQAESVDNWISKKETGADD